MTFKILLVDREGNTWLYIRHCVIAPMEENSGRVAHQEGDKFECTGFYGPVQMPWNDAHGPLWTRKIQLGK